MTGASGGYRRLPLSVFSFFSSVTRRRFRRPHWTYSRSRANIQEMAAVWAGKVGYHPENPFNRPEIVATTFTEKTEDKAFLEQELGQE
jgi:hypothetical protein